MTSSRFLIFAGAGCIGLAGALLFWLSELIADQICGQERTEDPVPAPAPDRNSNVLTFTRRPTSVVYEADPIGRPTPHAPWMVLKEQLDRDGKEIVQ